MARFDRQIATALRLIKKNGQLVTWRQVNRTPDADKPWEVASAPVNHDVYICFLPVGKEGSEFIAYLSGSNEVKTGSVIGLMGAVDFEPSASDVVIRDGAPLTIQSVDVLAPNGQRVLYTVEFKA